MAQLTPLQQQRLAQAYVSDATTRGLDDKGMIRELLQLLLVPRAQQLNQLQNLVTRVRAGIATQQANFDAAKAAESAGLDQIGTNLDDLTTAIPGMP